METSDDDFIVHPDGLAPYMEDVLKAIQTNRRALVCLTGLPGVGKSATAKEVFRRARPEFEHGVELSGRKRPLEAVQFVDSLYVALPVPRERSDNPPQLVKRLLEFFEQHRVLLFIDNADTVDAEVAQLLSQISSPSKALITIRDPAALRVTPFQLVEFEHPGMTSGELDELLAALAERTPALRHKYELATPSEIQLLVSGVQGWPEALILCAGHLATSLLQFRDIQKILDQADVYGSLLGELYAALPRGTQRVLLATSAFPASSTDVGIAAVVGQSSVAVGKHIRRLLDLHLLEDLSPGGRFRAAHPIVREFLDRRFDRRNMAAHDRELASTFLLEWCATFGGQPKADWSNFAQLDMEFDNVPPAMEALWTSKHVRLLTVLFRSLFSYLVERGHWLFTESWCERASAATAPPSYRADWLIWWSWIKFYLREDYPAAAALAEEAIALRPQLLRQRFEAHRRALVAYARLGDGAAVDRHRAGAETTCRGAAADDETIDLKNSVGDALLQLAKHGHASGDYDLAYASFTEAETLASSRTEPNTREVGVARIGRARALLATGNPIRARDLAASAVQLAERLAWIRGVGEGCDLLADVNMALREEAEAAVARTRASEVRRKLRASPSVTIEPIQPPPFGAFS